MSEVYTNCYCAGTQLSTHLDTLLANPSAYGTWTFVDMAGNRTTEPTAWAVREQHCRADGFRVITTSLHMFYGEDIPAPKYNILIDESAKTMVYLR